MTNILSQAKMDNSEASFTLPQAVMELIRRMTPEEKQQLSKLLSFQDLEELKTPRSSANGRRFGDPKFYIGTTPKGLSLEIQKEQINAVLRVFLEEFSPKNIELFLTGSQDFTELKLLPEELNNLIAADPSYFFKRHVLIEMDDNEITSAGEGCMSISLNPAMMAKRSSMATKILNTCGYSYKFKSTQFYAVDWDEGLEVEENC